jgi:hypothetical protein
MEVPIIIGLWKYLALHCTFQHIKMHTIPTSLWALHCTTSNT